VLRLGRNNGDFLAPDVSYEDIIAAITGATDNILPARPALHVAGHDSVVKEFPTRGRFGRGGHR
jgi:hypothetical protein